MNLEHRVLLKVNGRAESRRPVWQSEEEQVPGLLLLSCVRGWGSNLLGWSKGMQNGKSENQWGR